MAQNKAHQLLQLAIDSQITQYAAVASLTVLAFDCLISFRREVEMVWIRSKSPIKWLYIWLYYVRRPRINVASYTTKWVTIESELVFLAENFLDDKCHNDAGYRGYYPTSANLDPVRSITADTVCVAGHDHR
ncbi:hypothetical protein B0H11DRAFT_1912768 [Mycena galericulata]|nr:hypothetical protein B0H11DRAFT_1912768 [Mycena galericulata]